MADTAAFLSGYSRFPHRPTAGVPDRGISWLVVAIGQRRVTLWQSQGPAPCARVRARSFAHYGA